MSEMTHNYPIVSVANHDLSMITEFRSSRSLFKMMKSGHSLDSLSIGIEAPAKLKVTICTLFYNLLIYCPKSMK